MSRSEIVLTGLGTVNATGCGRPPMTAALRDGRPVWSEVDRPAGYHRHHSARLAGLANGYDLSTWLPPRDARRMSPVSKFAVAAARMALAEAEIQAGKELAGRPTAMVFSNAFGPSSFSEKIVAQIRAYGPPGASPALFTESVANAPAAQVAIACRALGANITITQREAGATMALARAAAEVARGRAGYAVVVTVDEVTPLLHAVLDRFGALARPDSQKPNSQGANFRGANFRGELARPFDRWRDGFILAEGATAVVVETAATAEQRGIRPLARLEGSASGFDPRAPVSGWGPDPVILAPILERLLRRSAKAGSDGFPEAVVCSASGAVAGDRLEARLLTSVWGERPLPPLLAPKAVLGEFGGAQLAAAILALEGEPFGPIPGFSEVDPELGVAPHDGSAQAPRSLLISSLATGGAASWVLLARPGRG